MKWLSRLTSNRSGDEIPTIVSFHELDSWLDKVSNLIFRGMGTNTVALYEELEDKRDELRQCITELRDAEPRGDMPPQIMKIGLLSRDKMVKLLYSLCDRIVTPANTQTSYKTILEFYNRISTSMESVLWNISKSIYYVRSLFPEEVRAVEAELEQVRAILDRLVSPMKGKDRVIQNLSRVYGLMEEIRELMREIEVEEGRIRADEEECTTLRRGIELSEWRLEEIGSDAEWKQVVEYEAELRAIEHEQSTLRSDINNLFAPLQKPLSLLKKQDSTGRIALSPALRTAITSLMSPPVQALNADVETHLRSIKELMQDTKLMNDRKRVKTLKWIDHLLNTDLSGIRARYDSLLSRAEEVRSRLSVLKIKDERDELEQAIKSARGQLTRLEEGIARRRRGIVSLEKELEARVKVLQTELGVITGKRIEVKFEFRSDVRR